jgi:hypothetical protein
MAVSVASSSAFRPVIFLAASCSVFMIAIAFGGCQSASVPRAYGIYANTDKGRISLNGQQVEVRGSLLSFVSGLKEPSGTECKALESFVVFLKGVSPGSIGVVRLEFVTSVPVSGFMAQGTTTARLWMPKDLVGVDIEPVDKHEDMYIVRPKSLLGKGFYALHIGPFAAEIPSSRPVVFDVVVGSAQDFPSYEAKMDAMSKAACSKSPNSSADTVAICQGVIEYLDKREGQTGLDMTLMKIEISNVTLQNNNEATATVSFHPTSGGAQGMSMNFVLARMDSKWVVKGRKASQTN